MSFSFCTSGAIVFKAGRNANSDVTTSGGILAQVYDEAEAFVTAITRLDLQTSYSTYDTNRRAIISEAVANLAAMNLITWDMSGFTSRYEAETMLDVLRDRALSSLSLLKDKKTTTSLT